MYSALDELDTSVYHQGGWICPAASAALPYLVDLAAGTATHRRNEIVQLIARFVGEAAIVPARFLDEDWPDALERCLPQILTLLADPDPLVRREATRLVSLGGLPRSDLEWALWERWPAETDRITRWDLTLALGDLLARHPSVPDIRAELHNALDSSDAQLGLAALHALARSEPELPPARAAWALAALQDPHVAGWAHDAWFGSQRAFVDDTLHLLQPDD